MENETKMGRRERCCSLVGTGRGAGPATYQAMTGLGFASEFKITPGTDQANRRYFFFWFCFRRRPCGLPAALELREAGYEVQVLEFQQPPRRPQLFVPRRRQIYESAARHRPRVPARPLSQPRPALIPHYHRTLSHYGKASGVASNPSSSSITMRLVHPRRRLAASGNATRHRDRLSGPCFRIALQGDATRRARQAVTKEDKEKLRRCCEPGRAGYGI